MKKKILSPSIHKFGDEFIPSCHKIATSWQAGLSAERALFIATTGTNT
ncbi:MAG: hypothetical protein KJ666_01705 [Bacteroidetes bacterium]|nr:hypothetical protein [Bacteroidota bacterium]MBU2586081.1 hypothetical protein [Bacteroidota bacterium]